MLLPIAKRKCQHCGGIYVKNWITAINMIFCSNTCLNTYTMMLSKKQCNQCKQHLYYEDGTPVSSIYNISDSISFCSITCTQKFIISQEQELKKLAKDIENTKQSVKWFEIQEVNNINFDDVLLRENLLPIKLFESDEQDVIEIIFCNSIAGGAFYIDNMPATLTLSRVLKDGTRYDAVYVQKTR